MVYDVNSNPRSLAEEPISDEERNEIEQRIHNLRQQMQSMGKQTAMFGSDGWEATKLDLYSSLQDAVNSICDPQTPLDEVPYLRGRITEVHRLLALGDSTKNRQQMLRDEIKSLEAVLDGRTVEEADVSS